MTYPTFQVCLPAGQKFVAFNEVAHLIAKAKVAVPEQGTDMDNYDLNVALLQVDLEGKLEKLVRAGELQLFNSFTYEPELVYADLEKSLITIAEFSRIAAVRNVDVVSMNTGMDSENEEGMTNPKARNEWTEGKLRELYRKSIAPGITTKKLADEYGITRQGIAKQIKEAKKYFSTDKSKLKNNGFAWKTK